MNDGQQSWILFYDYLADCEVCIGNTPRKEGRLLPHSIRLYDDDGVLYFSGRTDRLDFDPLDWAAANCGCTELRYLEAGAWRTL